MQREESMLFRVVLVLLGLGSVGIGVLATADGEFITGGLSALIGVFAVRYGLKTRYYDLH